MWNTSFVLPSLLVLVILLAYYFFRPRLANRMNKAFLILIVTDVATILTDVLATLADEQYEALPLPLVSLLNLLYFVSFIARILAFFYLTLVVLKLDIPRFSWIKHTASLVFILCEGIVLSSPFTGAVYSVDSAGYHRGPLYGILPACSFFYLAFGIILLICFGKRTRKSFLISAFAFHFILIAGNIVRILYPQYLVMNVFCLLAILIIFLAFENPDLYITDRGPAFNTRAFTEWLDDPLHRKNKKALGFAIRNYNDERSMYGGIQMDQGLGLIISWLVKRFPHFLLFYLRGGNFALVGAENADWETIRRDISERFQQPWRAESVELNLNVTYVEIGLSGQDTTSDRIVNTLIYALDEAGESADIEQSVMSQETLQKFDAQIEIKRWLDQAIDNDQVEVFLQPIIDSHTRQVFFAEALARIRDDGGKLIPPGLFIPIAEKNGQINLLGEQVLRKTCAFLRERGAQASALRWINVNLSPIQCMNSGLAPLFSSILQKYNVPVDKIHLEITEEAMLNYDKQARQIEALQRSGFQIAVDDYGSGFSNLHQVKKHAFSNIKLDMSIVWDYVRDRDSLLPALVQAFKQMGFSITAEGVETKEAADALTEIGCDYLQGYYFSKPLPLNEFIETYLS
ncbi:MAG: EAL domain-containing protein [Clostridia bacterium]|jgi:EAL domain-containing protein (putative c-di-GMP-specific phosphodiesterase class I)|nr:EAL domain-containing protein [Clostridia bacterium]